ncbi:transporter substrate-binding domain-containing protein [Pectinatus haikarae]|uniref:Lysine transport system substrate-binding protein n=1 Tax=Pectinatus haikarae TaxID=349096 RepID=A0ABT9Y7V6_9FIRM|nr:transporter substrate-binding domain-containing protein [Pectinatus haikarae]MDQ0203913.1 putative lysine transport system substrate-binding protein [Pectinatus haikarae]
MKVTKKIAAIIAVCVLTIGTALIAGCGGSADSDKKVLRVGLECAYAPFNWAQNDDANGAVKIADADQYAMGYDILMAKKIADGMGYKLEIHKMEWDGLIPAVNTGKIDAVIAGMSITEKRKQTVDFSDVYYNASIVALVKKDGKYAEAKSVADLKGAVATSQLNTVWYDLIDQIPNADKQPAIDNVPGMVVALTSGKVDVLVLDKPTAMAAAYANPDLKMLDFKDEGGFKASTEDVEMGIAVKKGNSELLQKINEQLAKINEDDRAKMMEEAIKDQPLAK